MHQAPTRWTRCSASCRYRVFDQHLPVRRQGAPPTLRALYPRPPDQLQPGTRNGGVGVARWRAASASWTATILPLCGMNPPSLENIRAGDRRDCSSGRRRHPPAARRRALSARASSRPWASAHRGRHPCIYYGTERTSAAAATLQPRADVGDQLQHRRAPRRRVVLPSAVRRLITIRRNPALRLVDDVPAGPPRTPNAEHHGPFERVGRGATTRSRRDHPRRTAPPGTGRTWSALAGDALHAPAGTRRLVDDARRGARSVTVEPPAATVVQMGPWRASVFDRRGRKSAP